MAYSERTCPVSSRGEVHVTRVEVSIRLCVLSKVDGMIRRAPRGRTPTDDIVGRSSSDASFAEEGLGNLSAVESAERQQL